MNAEPSRAPKNPRPGSQSSLRQHNEQRILNQLGTGPKTQAMLVRATGLSAGTVSNVVKRLLAEGSARTEPTTSSGRRALNIVLESESANGLGIDFHRDGIRMAVAAAGQRIIAESSTSTQAPLPAAEAIELAWSMYQQLLENHGLSAESISAVGVSLAAPIDQRTGLPASNTILPQWAGVDVAQAVSARFHLPVHVDNDANLAALGESLWGGHASTQDMIYVKIDAGIGAGLIFNGQLYRGHIGITGEIGHATLDDSGLPCRCGNRGCLETHASTGTMLERLANTPRGPRSVAELLARAADGQHATLRVIDDSGSAVGKVLGFISSLVNPELIVLGGPLAPLGEILLEPVRRGHARYTTPSIVETTLITTSTLGPRAEVLGAAALALHQAQQLARPLSTASLQG